MFITFTGRLQSDLIKSLLHKLNNTLKDGESLGKQLAEDKILRIIKILEHLLPFLLMFSITNSNVLNQIEKEMTMEIRKFYSLL